MIYWKTSNILAVIVNPWDIIIQKIHMVSMMLISFIECNIYIIGLQDLK